MADRDRKRRCGDQDYKHDQPYRDEGARVNGGHTVVAHVEFHCGSQSAFTQKRSESDLRPPYARQCEKTAPPPDGNLQDDPPCALRRWGRVDRGVPNPTTRRLQLSVPHSTCQAHVHDGYLEKMLLTAVVCCCPARASGAFSVVLRGRSVGLAQAARSAVPARRGGEVRDTEHDYPTRADGTIVVGLLADKGMPALIAQRLIDKLPDVLTRQLSNRVEWQVHARCDPLLLDENGLIPMLDLADRQKPAHDWDVLVLLTDLPRRAGTQPIVYDYSTSRAVGLVSIPALGACRVPKRTRNLIVHVIGHLLEEKLGLDPQPRRHSPHGRLTRRLGDVLAPTSTFAPMMMALTCISP